MIRVKYNSRNSQGDSRRMIRATGDDLRNSMDISCKQAAMLCLFQIKIELLYLPYLSPMCVGIASC